jgi:hypothetical protein
MVRASYLKYNYDISQLIENTEKMFNKQITNLFALHNADPNDRKKA